jgi:plasmid stability protein
MPACAQHEEAAMTVMIQIRNVPEQVHRVLKARSALLGKSLSDVILEELQAMAALPAPEELLQQLREVEPFKMKRSSAASDPNPSRRCCLPAIPRSPRPPCSTWKCCRLSASSICRAPFRHRGSS